MSERESGILSQQITDIWREVVVGKRPIEEYYRAIEEWRKAVERESETGRDEGEEAGRSKGASEI